MKSMILAWTARGMTIPGMKASSRLSRAVRGAFRKRGLLLIPQQSRLPCHWLEGTLSPPGFTCRALCQHIAGTDSGLLSPILALEQHGLAVGCLQIICSTSIKKWILLPSPGLG